MRNLIDHPITDDEAREFLEALASRPTEGVGDMRCEIYRYLITALEQRADLASIVKQQAGEIRDLQTRYAKVIDILTAR